MPILLCISIAVFYITERLSSVGLTHVLQMHTVDFVSLRMSVAWHISMHMFVQVQACTCASMLSVNAPHVYALRSRSFEVR